MAFQGRDALLEELTNWCAPSSSDFSAPATVAGVRWGAERVQTRLVTGPGGSGKSRLSTELATRMAAIGWTAVRLTSDPATSLAGFSRIRRPVLVIIDYAETRIEQLLALLRAVDREDGIAPVRLLALARAAGEWWTRAGEDRDGFLIATARIHAMPPLHHTHQERADAYRQALHYLGRRLGDVYPTVDWDSRLPDLTMGSALPALASPEYDLPLSIQMAALLALLDTTGRPDPVGSRSLSLEGRLLGHERRYWDQTASARGLTGERTGEETRALAIALACLVPATDRDHARDLLAYLPGLSGEDAAGTRGALATWLGDLYPADNAVWGSLQPDRIAEHHVGAQVRREPMLFTRILSVLDHENAGHAFTVLTRATEHPEHEQAIAAVLRDALTTAPSRLCQPALSTATQISNPKALVDALTHLVRNSKDTDLLKDLSDQTPNSTVNLADWALYLTTTLVQCAQRNTEELDDNIELASALLNQSNRLGDLGRREEALQAITQAVNIFEAAAEEQSEAVLPALSAALNNQSNRLSQLGQRAEALDASNKAVKIREYLADKQPDAFLYHLAMSLNNQGNCLANLGLREQALHAITRALLAHQALSRKNPEAFLPEVARSLNNQSVCLSELGRHDEALRSAIGAVETYQTLADEQPDAFLSLFAGSLSTQSNCLAMVGKRVQALHAASKAVDIYRALVAVQQEAFLPYFAMALNTQSNRLAELGRREEALEAATQALEIRKTLAVAHPDAFLPDFAASLNNRSNRLADLGRQEEALEAATQALEIRKTLAVAHPDAFLPDFALSLNNQANRFNALGQHTDALQAATQALDVYMALTEKYPDSFLPDLAMALNNKSGCLAALGHHEAALEVITQAVRVYKTLAEEYPDTYRPYLATALNNQCGRLAEVGKRTEALQAATNAVAILEGLAENNARLYGPLLRSSLLRRDALQ
ncbi:tetratricopeptide repeat protein [Streptomyces longwoodensis]|uniref:tetratricopeptide repeat protein n=1 Tax=Streptomyces longwoodensis TaxID=68231 RepID=UPI0033CB9121